MLSSLALCLFVILSIVLLVPAVKAHEEDTQTRPEYGTVIGIGTLPLHIRSSSDADLCWFKI